MKNLTKRKPNLNVITKTKTKSKKIDRKLLEEQEKARLNQEKQELET